MAGVFTKSRADTGSARSDKAGLASPMLVDHRSIGAIADVTTRKDQAKIAFSGPAGIADHAGSLLKIGYARKSAKTSGL